MPTFSPSIPDTPSTPSLLRHEYIPGHSRDNDGNGSRRQCSRSLSPMACRTWKNRRVKTGRVKKFSQNSQTQRSGTHPQDWATNGTASAANGQEAITQFQDTCWKLMQDLEGGRFPSDAAGQEEELCERIGAVSKQSEWALDPCSKISNAYKYTSDPDVTQWRKSQFANQLAGSLIIALARDHFMGAATKLLKLDYQSYNGVESDGVSGSAQSSLHKELCALLDQLESFCQSITTQLKDLEE